ncbi:MAG: AMP-binding protein [Verrucomicrobiales bacterium]|nr:AMP-binding protein [Verrucomicrobiales bacterium]
MQTELNAEPLPTTSAAPPPATEAEGRTAGTETDRLPISVGLSGWRRLLWQFGCLITRLVYRLRVAGRSHLPAAGGALLVANHLSFVDACILAAATGRYVRFLMHGSYYQNPLLGALWRLLGVIPVATDQRPRDLIRSLRLASESIRSGELVCIFAEGQVSRTGQMLPFRRGFERIMDGLDAPVIPVCLESVWGSVFSFARRGSLSKLRQRIPHPVSVSFGGALPASATPTEVRQCVQELSSEAWLHRKESMQPLHRSFVTTARRHPFRFAMGDQRTPRLNFLNALARTVYLARRLRPHWEGQEKVGLLLPPSIGGALGNFAALLMGRTPVNLNYTASAEALASSVQQCGIRTILSSQAFLDKVKLDLPFAPLQIEELAARPRRTERLTALAMSLLLPPRWLERAVGCVRPVRMDDPATVIFSSGSTGEPKGVMLSHFNVAANVAQLNQVFGLTPRDGFLGTLPFFHSFGFTGTLVLTGILGVGVAYHPTPLDAAAVGRLVREHGLTFLLSTPTFLQLYVRGCAPEDFGSLRIVMAGAEKLPDRLATAFEDKFGIRPLEGYGCTECAPAVAVNAPGFRAAGFHQVGAKRGTIGHPLPGVAVRIVDPGTRAPLPVGQPGLLLVRGPNVMQGYLGRPGLTAEVLRDGWYVTGDIAAQDADGFLQLTDRLSRFSKIGGEMVPHIKIEETLQELAGSLERTLVVTGVGDERKGERLVVLHCLDEEALQTLLAKLPGLSLPKLWVPKANQFFRIEALPLLGSGKLDLTKVRELAARCLADQ